MDYQKANEKIANIQKTGLYNASQIETIKYCVFRSDIDEEIFLDPNNIIPSDYISMYTQLLVLKKPIHFYIQSKWHNLGFSPKQLKLIIEGHLAGISIADITPNMSIEDIQKIIYERVNQKNLEKKFQETKMSLEEVNKLKKAGFTYDVLSFFLKVYLNDPEINLLFDPKYAVFSLEQIKYLYSVLSTGTSIDTICNPNLSVEQMKNIMLKNSESNQFIEEVMQNHMQRKRH